MFVVWFLPSPSIIIRIIMKTIPDWNMLQYLLRWVAVHHSSMSDSDLTDWQDNISADAIRDREAAASIVCCVTSMGERFWGQTAEQSHSLLSLIVSSALGVDNSADYGTYQTDRFHNGQHVVCRVICP